MNTSKRPISLLLIGIGPHSKRVYVPAVQKLSKNHAVSIALGVELADKKQLVENYFTKIDTSFPVHYIESFDPSGEIPSELAAYLEDAVKEHSIDGVIIATEPRAHMCYARWALKNELHILMDKPISTRENVVSDEAEAVGIVDDLLELEEKYAELQKKKETIFSINVQRRFHFGLRKVTELIREVAEEYNMPVTSIQSTHADGQWYFPIEILERKYHPLNEGYGKCSHSGYHFFDIVSQFYKAGLVDPKKAGTSAEVYTSFIQPKGWIKNITDEDYKKYFGEEYEDYSKGLSQDDFATYFTKYGELDAASIIRVKHEDDAICNISINLFHNSFSRRSWMKQGEDLYKGNGRVKHEHHIIQQGPFQSIHVHSYQAKSEHDVSTKADFNVGGNNHFEIYVFRNDTPFTKERCQKECSPILHFSTEDLLDLDAIDDAKIIYEETKRFVVQEFVEFIEGKRTKQSLISNIDSHRMSVDIMSAVYKSHIQGSKGKNPIATITL